jgi:hypothetical protein
MSQQRRTRTKTTDAAPARHGRKLQQLRLEIAQEAARIIATENQGNYHLAKKKAAERIGVSQRLALPSNIEVHDALLHYQQLYGGQQHADNLEQMRLAAIAAMGLLQAFSPRLVGPVLDGTAGRHSRVSLHVFCDAPENVLLFLLEHGIAFSQEQRQIRWHDGGHRTVPLMVIEHDQIKTELVVFALLDLRQAPPSPIDGRPQRRASVAEVQCLVRAGMPEAQPRSDQPEACGLVR